MVSEQRETACTPMTIIGKGEPMLCHASMLARCAVHAIACSGPLVPAHPPGLLRVVSQVRTLTGSPVHTSDRGDDREVSTQTQRGQRRAAAKTGSSSSNRAIEA